MIEIDIRVARSEEQTALETLQWRSSLANENDREALLAHPEVIELPMQQIVDGLVFVAEVEGVARGFAALLRRDDGDIELDGLFVEPAYWKQGIGRALVDYCAAFARLEGAAYLQVIGGLEAVPFYRRIGFEDVGPYETQFGPALRLRLRL